MHQIHIVTEIGGTTTKAISYNTKANLVEMFGNIDSETADIRIHYTSKEITINASSGENLIFYVYPTDQFCSDKYIYSIRIQLPTYNKYYKDPVCVGVENYTLCNKWSTHNMSYEKFTQNVIEYKKSLEKPPATIEEPEEKGIKDYIIEFLVNYSEVPF